MIIGCVSSIVLAQTLPLFLTVVCTRTSLNRYKQPETYLSNYKLIMMNSEWAKTALHKDFFNSALRIYNSYLLKNRLTLFLPGLGDLGILSNYETGPYAFVITSFHSVQALSAAKDLVGRRFFAALRTCSFVALRTGS